MIIRVRNFGKIKTADIDLADFVVFVGENNSGKSYLMQVIYGILSLATSHGFRTFLMEYNGITVKDKTIIEKDDKTFYIGLRDAINQYIEKNKTSFIDSIFHTNELTVESISIDFDMLPDEYSVEYEGEKELNNEVRKEYCVRKNGEVEYRFALNDFSQDEEHRMIKNELLSNIIFDLFGLKKDFLFYGRNKKQVIYLPAARSGMVLMYANYLADVKKTPEYTDNYVALDPIEMSRSGNEYGLTDPAYDFLQFMLKYKYSANTADFNGRLISFIQRYIVEGKFEKVGNMMRYIPADMDKSIPIYLASSLATELIPIFQLLSGVTTCYTVLYDEIETCQHPTKQLQLARLLVRMVNAGYRMVVSTHSDTMAATINNLLMLSSNENRDDLAKRLHYEQEDILKNRTVKAYQFKVENGKSCVEEVDGYLLSGLGFDFKLFNASNDKIYQDAVTLSGGVS